MIAASRPTALLCGLLTLAAATGRAHAIQQPSPVSPDELKNLSSAAERGDPNAQFRMGLAYAAGRGVAQNDADALDWFRKAGEKGHARAQYMTGLAYF